MGLLSQEGHVGLKTQTAKGTYTNPGAVAPNQGVFMRIRSGALGGDRELLVPDPEIGGNRDVPGAALGPIAFSGEYDFYGRMEAMPTLIRGALGGTPEVATVTVDATAGNFTLTYGAATTASIAFNATASAVQTALEALATIDPGDIVVTGGPGGAGGATPYVITFAGRKGYGDQGVVTGADVSLTGGGDAITVVMSNATTSGSGALGYTHHIEPGATLPWISVEEKIANAFDVFAYTDAKVNTIHLEADADGFLMGTAGMIALTQGPGTATAVSAQRNDTSPLIVGTNVLVEFGGVQMPAKSFSLDFTNNLEDDDFRLGSLFLGALTEKRRELTVGVTIRPEDSDYWRQAMWGSAAAVTPGGLPTYDDVLITIETYEDIPGANPGVVYSMVWTIPQAVFRPYSVDPSGDDVLEHDLEIMAVRPDPNVDLCSVDIKNSYTTIA